MVNSDGKWFRRIFLGCLVLACFHGKLALAFTGSSTGAPLVLALPDDDSFDYGQAVRNNFVIINSSFNLLNQSSFSLYNLIQQETSNRAIADAAETSRAQTTEQNLAVWISTDETVLYLLGISSQANAAAIQALGLQLNATAQALTIETARAQAAEQAIYPFYQTNISTQAQADLKAWQTNISTQASADRLAWQTNISTVTNGFLTSNATNHYSAEQDLDAGFIASSGVVNNSFSANDQSYFNHLWGTNQTQTTHDTIYLGGGGNFFIDKLSAGANIFGYNTPKPSAGGSVFTYYNNTTDKIPLIQANTAGTSSGVDSVDVQGRFSATKRSSFTDTTDYSIYSSSGIKVNAGGVTAAWFSGNGSHLTGLAGGGGNVSNIGTPVAGTLAMWQDSTHVSSTTALSTDTIGSTAYLSDISFTRTDPTLTCVSGSTRTIATHGGTHINFHSSSRCTCTLAGVSVYQGILLDGEKLGSVNDEFIDGSAPVIGYGFALSFAYDTDSLSAGSHSVCLFEYTSGGTCTCYVLAEQIKEWRQ